MRSAMWSELRERVRRSPYLASIFRHLWASTMGKSRSSTGNSPSSSASSSPNSSSPEDPNQVQGSTQKQVCTGNRAYTRRKGQPQKILPTSEHFLPTEFCESDNFIESMNLNSMKQHFALNWDCPTLNYFSLEIRAIESNFFRKLKILFLNQTRAPSIQFKLTTIFIIT